MCVRRNIELRSCNHCCSGKALIITQPKCVFVALGIQHAMRMCRIVICGLPRSSTLFQKGAIFEGGVNDHEVCVSIFSTNFVRKVFHSKYK
jgi:hypothetical protein